MLYCSSDMVHDRHNCYFILVYFLPFYPLTAQKIKILKILCLAFDDEPEKQLKKTVEVGQ